MASEKKKLRIGDCEVEAWHSSDPGDGYEYSIDVRSYSEESMYPQFHLMRLRRVRPKELPDSCHIIFQSPKSEFKRVNFVEFKSNKGVYELEIILCIDYRDWEMRESVASFVDRFCDAVRKSITDEVTPIRTEYGYFIHCPFNISETKDIYEFYSEKERELERVYRNSLAFNPTEVVSKKYGEDRLHWWVRYVIVPLAGSGAIATVLAKYLLK